MSIQEFVANITLEEIEKIRELKLREVEKIPTFSFSKIRFSDLKKVFSISREIDKSRFDFWFSEKIEIAKETENFLKDLISQNEDFLSTYSEEDLKIHFLSPLFHKIKFKSIEYKFRDFYNEKIRYESEKVILNGEVDFVLAKGLFESEKPYFFIQEFKKGIEPSDPRPQLIAEMISGLEISNSNEMKGAFIVGSIWNFVILEKLGKDKYQYFVSENFDSSKIEDLKNIYKNLIFIKNEVLKNETPKI
jgi:hypothetical protein